MQLAAVVSSVCDARAHISAATPDSIRPLRAPKAQQDNTTNYFDDRSSAPAAAYTAPTEALPVSTSEPSQSKSRLLKWRRANLDAEDSKSHTAPFIPGSSAPHSVRENNEEGRKRPIFTEDAQGSTPQQFNQHVDHIMKDAFPQDHGARALEKDTSANLKSGAGSTTKISTPEDGATVTPSSSSRLY